MKEKFLWGVATASYQIEGAWNEENKMPSIWDTFTHQKGNTYRNQNGDIACDSYHRYLEDIQAMKELGVDVYRFSISWSRILPCGTGSINTRGLRFYLRLVNALLENGITPFITLYHWDMPQCLQDKGGFLNPDFPLWFEEYTRVVCSYFKDKVKHFITFNEPENCIYNGLITGKMAPGLKLTTKEALLAVHHILLAHGRSVKVLRENIEDVQIGFSACGWVPVPSKELGTTEEDAYQDYFDLKENMLGDGVALWLDPIFLGKYPARYDEVFQDEKPEITKEDMELISQKIDFCGMNLYSGYYVKKMDDGSIVAENPLERKQMDNGWYILPEVMYFSPKFIYRRYHIPVIITENGSADYARPQKKEVHDTMRIACLKDYLSFLNQARKEGVDIRGYFHWTLMDNFEWERGYQVRMGLMYTEYNSHRRRIKKDSFSAYQEIIQKAREEELL